ncbi:MAG: patatin-like phospholipase family protein [Actinomycetota bacterium]|nr:patatin-like phospholipase family protein [Actinomycetota bacterium]
MSAERSPSVALVLGAGGALGSAYHAGALAALAEVTGWDLRELPLVVGTSAGSSTAAILRSGVAPADLFARATGAELSPEARELVRDEPSDEHPEPRPARPTLPLPSSPRLALTGVALRWPPRPGLALAGSLPRGTKPTTDLQNRIRAITGDAWPDAATWICTVRLDNGRRVVIGRDDVTPIDLPLAVAASCAVPGWFEPVTFGGAEHIDGGAHSPTNADLTAGCGFDLVIVSSPMSAPTSVLRAQPTLATRALHHTELVGELRAVKASGSAVIGLEPDAAVVDAMGPVAHDASRSAAVAEAARTSVLASLTSGPFGEALAGVGAPS